MFSYLLVYFLLAESFAFKNRLSFFTVKSQQRPKASSAMRDTRILSQHFSFCKAFCEDFEKPTKKGNANHK